MNYDDDFEDIDQITALKIMDGKIKTKPENSLKPKQQFKQHTPKIDNQRLESLKKELAELRSVLTLRNEKIKQLNAEKIKSQHKVKSLESRCDYFENFKIQVRHHVGTDEFLKIIESINK